MYIYLILSILFIISFIILTNDKLLNITEKVLMPVHNLFKAILGPSWFWLILFGLMGSFGLGAGLGSILLLFIPHHEGAIRLLENGDITEQMVRISKTEWGFNIAYCEGFVFYVLMCLIFIIYITSVISYNIAKRQSDKILKLDSENKWKRNEVYRTKQEISKHILGKLLSELDIIKMDGDKITQYKNAYSDLLDLIFKSELTSRFENEYNSIEHYFIEKEDGDGEEIFYSRTSGVKVSKKIHSYHLEKIKEKGVYLVKKE